MLTSGRKGSAFVPHDIARPIRGATAGPLAGLTAAVKDMYDIAGLPQVTLPIGYVAGCPVGASLIGWAGADEVLLEAATALGAWCGP